MFNSRIVPLSGLILAIRDYLNCTRYDSFFSKETMNLQEQFYRVMNRLKTNSRAASTSNARVTEMINGLLVSKPAKQKIIDLQEYAKSGKAAAASVQ
jgi:hypothetical protein